MEHDTVVVGITYPLHVDARPQAAIDQDIANLRAVAWNVEVVLAPYTPDAELSPADRAAWARMSAVLTFHLPPDLPAIAPRLQWVQVAAAGVDHVADRLAGMSDVALTSATGVNAVSVAEFAITRLLEHWKHLPAIAALQHQREWSPRYGRRLQGSTVGVIGLGAIGTEICRRLRAFDVTLWGCRRDPSRVTHVVDHLVGPHDLPALYAACDAIIVAVPETPDTEDLLDDDAFSQMKPGAWVCNISRGSVVDEPALVRHLESGHLSGAAIDVTRTEPLPADSPLWDVAGLQISGHCASSLDGYFENVHALFRDNLQRFVTGRPLMNRVDLGRGY